MSELVDLPETFARISWRQLLPSRNTTTSISIGIGLGVVLWTFFKMGDPILPLILGFVLAPVYLRLIPKASKWIVLLASVPASIAMWIFSRFYMWLFLDVLFPRGFPENFIAVALLAFVLAPIMEEFMKGSMYFLVKGGKWNGFQIGLGFGCFEAALYMLVGGIDLFPMRSGGIVLHSVATMYFFQGMSSGKKRFIVLAIVLHMVWNTVMIMWEVFGK